MSTHDSEIQAASAALSKAHADVSRLASVYARAKARLDAWKGPMRGDLFEVRLNAWRAATLALDRATAARRRAAVNHYLLVRKSRPEAAA